jgi:sterol desaturase/sphingolipid hydroxylase (fatty acid hydroxylase superfamily)
MSLFVKFIYFLVIWFVEQINPDRKTERITYFKKNNFFKISNNRFVTNCAFGVLWIIFLSFFGKSIYELSIQFYRYTYHSLRFQRNNLFSFIIFFLIVDYLTYIWHVANHKFKFLRRFHQIHHSDLLVDFSTTFRFHFIELLLHFVLKLMLIYILRINFIWFFISETMLLFFGVFHHGNIYLPKKVDSILSLFIVTPRYHYNHHLLDLAYANSNYSSLLTIWDKIHGTYTIPSVIDGKPLGISSAREINQLSFLQLLKMPFKL